MGPLGVKKRDGLRATKREARKSGTAEEGSEEKERKRGVTLTDCVGEKRFNSFNTPKEAPIWIGEDNRKLKRRGLVGGFGKKEKKITESGVRNARAR